MISPDIHQACRDFADDTRHWADILAHKLDDQRIGLAYEWMKRCVRRLLPLQNSEHQDQLISDLDKLAAFEQSQPTHARIAERSREIWYRPRRDTAQTAVSKLYANVPASDNPFPRVRTAPIYLLVNTSPDKTDAFKLVIAEFEQCNQFGE